MNEDVRLRELRLAAARLMESELFAKMPGFTIPAQERTRVKTSAMIAVAAYMLQTRDFSDITVDEIADAAGCTTPSIYARFQNKEALLPAIHLLTIEETRVRLDSEIVLDRFLGKSLEYFCSVFVNIIVCYFEDNRNFVRATILSEVNVVHIQLQKIIPVLVARLNKIVPILINQDPVITHSSIEYGISTMMSILRDATVVPCIKKINDRYMLTRFLTIIINTDMVSKVIEIKPDVF